MIRRENGQISLDLIFSLLIVVIFITTMLFFISDYKTSKENIALENNLKNESINLASFINSASIMNDTNFETKILIKKINYGGELITPEIILGQNSITLTYNNKIAKTFFVDNLLAKEINGDYLVIKNVN